MRSGRRETKSELHLASRVKGERRNHRPGQAQEARGHPHGHHVRNNRRGGWQ